MTFVGEDGNQPLKIAVGFYVTHGDTDHHPYFDNTHSLLLIPQVVIQCYLLNYTSMAVLFVFTEAN